MCIRDSAKAYNPETAATDGGIAIVSEYDLEATPTKATVAQVYDFIIKDIEEDVYKRQHLDEAVELLNKLEKVRVEYQDGTITIKHI